ncbi:MAG: hypothetical protein ABSF35_18315 [Polyangia bacterium]|jgi:hypothetical protein
MKEKDIRERIHAFLRCSRAGWMMGMRADSTMGIARLTVARAVSVMPIVESAR